MALFSLSPSGTLSRTELNVPADILRQLDKQQQLKSGSKILFCGPNFALKTQVAALLGQETKRPVYRVNMIRLLGSTSKETFNNLMRLFEQTADRKWVLFFDETDELLGMKNSVNPAMNVFASMEINYTMMRLDKHKGIIIMATNHVPNIDTQYRGFFHSVTYFPSSPE